jgi:hypothetical protein
MLCKIIGKLKNNSMKIVPLKMVPTSSAMFAKVEIIKKGKEEGI